MWRNDTIRKGDLEGARLHVGWVARVVTSAGDIHGYDGAIRSPDYVCVARAVRERHMRDAREENYESRGCRSNKLVVATNPNRIAWSQYARTG